MPVFMVTAPDGRKLRVTAPDGATQEQAIAYAQQQMGQQRTTAEDLKRKNPAEYDSSSYEYANRYGSDGVNGIARDVGRAAIRAPITLADTAVSLARGTVAAPVAGLAGLSVAPVGFVKGHEGIGGRVVENVQPAIAGEPFTQGGAALTDAISYPFKKLAQGADWLGGETTDLTGSPLLGAATNAAVQSMPALLARGRVGNGRARASTAGSDAAKIETAARTAAPVKVERPAGLAEASNFVEKVPSVEELRTLKNEAYKRAEDTGIVVSRSAVNKLKVDLVNDLKKEGLNAKLHPKTSAALEEIINTKGQLTLTQLETLRKVANSAKGAIEPADSRLGARIVDKIDDFEEAMSESDIVSGNAASGAAFKEARALNTRLSKAETIQELFRRAELSAPNFSGSGMENALRTEFRSLAKNKREMRRFTVEERASIEKVAKGGPMENLLRQIGKLAPTGVVSAGMGAMAGAMVGGPVGAAVVPSIGFAARSLATRMTQKNATGAELLMRRGPVKSPAKQPETVK